MGSHTQEHAVGQRRVLPILGAVLLLLLALLAWRMLASSEDEAIGATGENARSGCSGRVLRFAVAPRIEPVVSQALDTLEGTTCVGFEVQSISEREAVDSVFFGGDTPDVWIPDGDWSVAGMPVEVVSRALASTPVVLAGGRAARRADSWATALTGNDVLLPDPLEDSVGTLGMLAPRMEAKAAGNDLDAAKAFLVPTAQSYGEMAATGEDVDASLTALDPYSTRAVATTEAELLTAQATQSWLQEVTPATGSPLIRFPLTVSEDASSVARAVANEVEAWFGSDEGISALRAVNLRRGDGRVSLPASDTAEIRLLPVPGREAVNDYRFTWQVMSVPSSVLAVFDVSGSMDYDAGGGMTRIDVAAEAAELALDLFPGHARVGLWVFSIDRGGPGQDWRVLEPVRRLDEEVDGVPQRERLLSHRDGLDQLTTGGTGLYDTALAAYERALANYSPDYANSVILLTDGANDDPGSVSGREVLRGLKAMVDPQRPVRIIGIAISEDADLKALRRIARATGGNAHRADAPEDILRVFAQEIAGR